MGGDKHDDDGARGILSQDCQTDCGNDIDKGRWRGMLVFLSDCGVVSYRDLVNKVLCEEAVGNNHGVCIRDTDIRIFTGAYQREGSSRFLMWWDQEHIPKQTESDGG